MIVKFFTPESKIFDKNSNRIILRGDLRRLTQHDSPASILVMKPYTKIDSSLAAGKQAGFQEDEKICQDSRNK